MKRIAAIATLIGLSRVVAAQPIDQTDPDPTTALAIGAGATAASFATMGLGYELYKTEGSRGPGGSLIVIGAASLLFTPALGHLHGEDRLFTAGTDLRFAGAAVLTIGAIELLADAAPAIGCAASSDNGNSNTTSCSSGHSTGPFVLGLAMIAGGTVLDLATTHSATERANHARHQLTFAPVVARSGNETVTGIGLGGRY